MHLSDAAGPERRLAVIALPALQIRDSILPEHPARDVALARRQMQKLRRENFSALFHRGIPNWNRVSRLLAEIWRRGPSAAIHANRLCLCGLSRRTDLRDVH